jgi:hypothetical protein
MKFKVSDNEITIQNKMIKVCATHSEAYEDHQLRNIGLHYINELTLGVEFTPIL